MDRDISLFYYNIIISLFYYNVIIRSIHYYNYFFAYKMNYNKLIYIIIIL